MTFAALVLVGMAIGLIAAVARMSRRRLAPPPPIFRAPAPARPRRRIRVDVPHALYHYDYADRPERIYLGITNSPPRRAGEHEDDLADQWWMSRSDRVMRLDQWYPNRAAALAAERSAIRVAYYAGHAIANDQHNPGRRRVVR